MARNALAVRPKQTGGSAQRPLRYVDVLPPLQGRRRRRPDWRRNAGLQMAFVLLALGPLVAMLWRAG